MSMRRISISTKNISTVTLHPESNVYRLKKWFNSIFNIIKVGYQFIRYSCSNINFKKFIGMVILTLFL